jgi:hypothetical protein
MTASLSFNPPISGSYAAEDCLFLLKPIRPPSVAVAEKERLLQSGQKHYSEMITYEHLPSVRYRDLFIEQTRRYKTRLAQDVLNLANAIRCSRPAPITLVSLARAGTPIGALLQRALTRHLKTDSRHFSISIIRDRGIDERALTYLLHVAQRPATGLVFVDGWTAKGVIARQLKTSIAAWNRRRTEVLTDALYVISDLSGTADVAASFDDYVIPSGILGATVSGLVSRSILNEQIGINDFHGCVVYEQLRSMDDSRWFLSMISREMPKLVPKPLGTQARAERRVETAAYLTKLQQAHAITHINHIKPGILEASRVMLRRMPGLLLLRDPHCPDVAHLQLLAAEKKVPIRIDPAMPFRATALIHKVQQVSASGLATQEAG